MCVPVPVDTKSGNITDKGKVTGGVSSAAQGIVNQMMTPFRRAATGETLVEQQQKFNDPKSMAALLTMPSVYDQQKEDERRANDRKKGKGIPVAPDTITTDPKVVASQGRIY